MTPAREEKPFSVSLTLDEGYAFDVDFEQPSVAALRMDEPAPLGAGSGPNAARLLAVAVGNCLSASLAHCLRKARVDVRGLRTTVEGTMVRNERGRFRIAELRVQLAPDVPSDQQERMRRCLELFEDFCIVTESVRQGIRVDVAVAAPAAAGV